MRNRGNLFVTIILVTTLVFIGTAWAQSIKDRMHSRLPIIKDLKARGVLGEDNQGYLAYVKGASEKQALVAAENKDRKMVYKAIAKKKGTSPDLVGKRRAIQLAKKAPAGEWLQDAKGQWYKKK